MSNWRRVVAAGVAWTSLLAQSQELAPTVIKPSGPVLIRSYKPTFVPPVRLGNSKRLKDLIRAGKLYLTVQDAIAVAIENNLDLEVDRYGPLIAQSQLQRAQAGGH